MPKSKKPTKHALLQAVGLVASHRKILLFLLTAVFALAAFSFASARSSGYITDTKWRLPEYPAKPPSVGYLGSYTDYFGHKVIKISGNPGDPIPNLPGGVWGKTVKPRYQTESVWNADESMMRLTNDGRPSEVFLDGRTYRPLPYRPGTPGIMVWHPRYPKIRVFAKGNQLGWQDVTTGKVEIKKTFSGYSGCTIHSKGIISDDGSKVAIECKSGPGSGRKVFFAYDMDKDIKYPDITAARLNIVWSKDHTFIVTISPSGKYILIGSCFQPGVKSCAHTKIFDLQGNLKHFWGEGEWECPGHYDLGFDARGNEIAAGICKRGPADMSGKVIVRNLETGVREARTPRGNYSTSSSRNFKQKDWVFTSAPGRDPRPSWYPPYRDEILMVKLSGPLEVRRLVLTYFSPKPRLSNCRFTPSPKGTRVAFMTNELVPAGPIYTCVVETRD